MRRFIYLDTDTLNSYIAQIYDGLVQSEKREKQSEKSENIQSKKSGDIEAEADLKIMGKGFGGKIDAAYEGLKGTSNSDLIKDVQTKLLHDNAFDQLIKYLNKNNLYGEKEIGDFVEIKDAFYIVDLAFLKELVSNKQFLDFLKESEREKIKSLLKQEQDSKTVQADSNVNEINKKILELVKQKCKESDSNYEEIKRMIIMMSDIIPYRRVMCIGNNMVVLNDKHIRDDLNTASLKYGGKINVVGYITNKVDKEDGNNVELDPFEQVSSGLNQLMISFFGDSSRLNIIHPIAIYYE